MLRSRSSRAPCPKQKRTERTAPRRSTAEKVKHRFFLTIFVGSLIDVALLRMRSDLSSASVVTFRDDVADIPWEVHWEEGDGAHAEDYDRGSVSAFATMPEAGIRRWGCGRAETPFIFVHIGKAGGGGVRRQLRAAVSAGQNEERRARRMDNRTRRSSHRIPFRDDDGDGGETAERETLTFCSSGHSNYRPDNKRTFEGTVRCDAETPISQAVACPPVSMGDRCCGLRSSDSCPVVYAGHNYVGSEMHWLPPDVLRRWWRGTRWAVGAEGTDRISSLWTSLSNGSPCEDIDVDPQDLPRGHQNRIRKGAVTVVSKGDVEVSCPEHIRTKVDDLAAKALGGGPWSAVYASMPSLRATLIRDPFSWLVSKFFWHKLFRSHLSCNDIEAATDYPGYIPDAVFMNGSSASVVPLRKLKNDTGRHPLLGWASKFSEGYILQLCGEDCHVRLSSGSSSLDDIADQAVDNLRQSFAVVGLLNETDTFYDMISARVDYMNLSSINVRTDGRNHSTKEIRGSERCKKKFRETSFQTRLIAASPQVAALHRLYQMAVEVNRFQRNELQTCMR